MLQVSAHWDAAQPAIAWGAKVRHATPQAPQLAGSLAVCTQSAPHSVVPPEHESAHAPAEQRRPEGHTAPHAPQLAGSTARFAQAPPQAESPAPHDATQTPLEQIWATPQAVSQVPQCSTEACVSTQTPPHTDCPSAHWPASGPDTLSEQPIEAAIIASNIKTASEIRFIAAR